MGTITYHPNIDLVLDGRTLEIIRIAHGPISTPIPFHAHGRGCYELHYHISGHGTVFIDDDRHDMGPGALYITGPDVRHAQLPDPDDPIHEYCINLALHDAPGDATTNGYLPGVLASMKRFVCTDHESLSQLFPRLFEEYRQRRAGYRQCAEALLKEIIIAALRNNTKLPKPPQPYNAEAIANEATPVTDMQRSMLVDQYFLRDYGKQSLSGLAEELALGPRQTQRLLQRYYGKSFSEKTLESRMGFARLLLTETDASITDIAQHAGYASTAHFGAAFRTCYGAAPSEYRRNHR
ncbi:AraC family transcriptional regulator [Bifidobacterium sp. SO1]|uniref:helix-turn-helix transcriptional regulator n=1 Tax=Bifidobacterium sp. SO1 TaxID=2809029 RepID=UPI001BDCC9F3|nr:AraC family transcriptional regulator [Bifidobacterium sp. SO1]MBT1161081.1 AraC family transcriptional regulator [Bifidobacterium sp. SO1]